MNANGTVGIVMRTKDRPVLLRRALGSVIAQSFAQWDLVVVNDGGDPSAVDRLVAAMRPQARGTIRVVHNPASLGMQGASAIGLTLLETDLLIVHDDDDSWAPAFLEIARSELARTQADYPSARGVMTYANLVMERVRGNIVEIDSVEPFNGWIPPGFLSLDRLLASNVLPPISFLFERDAFIALGSVYEKIPYLGDWDFMVRFLREFDVLVVPQYLAFYHWRTPSETSAYDNTVTAEVERHHFYRQMLLNRWLREDISAGTFGVGAYANLRAHFPVVDGA